MTDLLRSDALLNATPAPRVVAPWDRLGGLFDALAAVGRSDPMDTVLQTVRETLAADVAVFEPGLAGGLPVVVGPAAATPSWGRTLLARLTTATVGGERELLFPAVPETSGLDPVAGSAALVCLSRTRGEWVAAVRLAPSRRFNHDDLRQLAYLRRVYANHLTQEQAKADLKDALFGLVHCLSSAIDAKDPYTAGHSERVARMAVRLAEQMRLPGAVQNDTYLAGLLHDVGKIGVSDAVLRKPGALTAEEFAEVKTHPAVGERIVSQVRQFRHLCPGVRWHHERLDGKGYPDGLAGENIPLMARVLAVADSVDAMTSSRPYREAMPRAKVEGILRGGAGSQWDAAVIDAFFACCHDLYAICNRGLGESVARALSAGSGVVGLASLRR
jgi:HD-GYP domain-containing protein (c-di-GMP phosphodiesterase class II)